MRYASAYSSVYREQRMSSEETTIQGRRLWPVRVVGLMLFIQSAAWLALAAYRDFSGAIVLPLAALAFIAAVGFAFVDHRAWVIAMLLQAFALAVTLFVHLRSGPSILDLLMAYSVLLVLYVNSRAVRAVLHGADDA